MSALKLYEVSDHGARHVVVAKSEGHAVQVVTGSFHVSGDGMEARKLDDLDQPKVVRSDYPEDYPEDYY